MEVRTLLYLTPTPIMFGVLLVFAEPGALSGLVGRVISVVGVLVVLRGRPSASQRNSSTPEPSCSIP